VVTAFAGLSKEQIFTRLSAMEPLKGNMELMGLLFREMPRYLDSFQVTEITGLAPVTVRKKCPSGQLQGAMKIKGKWMIPAATVRTLQRKPSRRDAYRRSEKTIDGPVEHVQRTDSPSPGHNPHTTTTTDGLGAIIKGAGNEHTEHS